MMPAYDYIIAGAGAAGLSLAIRLAQEPLLKDKKILIIDKARKTENDRTWCFWESGRSYFEDVVHHQWKNIHFYSPEFSSLLDIAPYTYKVIRGKDFYEHCFAILKSYPNVHIQLRSVDSIGTETNSAFVISEGEKIEAKYVFNSILFEPIQPSFGTFYLHQHFKGWEIVTDRNCFDPSVATFMDFRVSQHHGATFMYVLPLAPNRALVEYTLFNESLLPQETYEEALSDYIHNTLQIEQFQIHATEYGVIPMTNYKFPKKQGNIIFIGTAGGQTKASSGYTFQFIQKHSAAIVENLIRVGHPFVHTTSFQERFHLYDATLLRVLSERKVPGFSVFADLFKKNPATRVLRFLDNETSLQEEIKIMSSVPTTIFFPAAIKQMLRG